MTIILHTPQGKVVETMSFDPDVSQDSIEVWEKNIESHVKAFNKKWGGQYPVTKVECQNNIGRIMYTKEIVG